LEKAGWQRHASQRVMVKSIAAVSGIAVQKTCRTRTILPCGTDASFSNDFLHHGFHTRSAMQ
jgi:hypothetical protein